jgi:hypothetical protein
MQTYVITTDIQNEDVNNINRNTDTEYILLKKDNRAKLNYLTIQKQLWKKCLQSNLPIKVINEGILQLSSINDYLGTVPENIQYDIIRFDIDVDSCSTKIDDLWSFSKRQWYTRGGYVLNPSGAKKLLSLEDYEILSGFYQITDYIIQIIPNLKLVEELKQVDLFKSLKLSEFKTCNSNFEEQTNDALNELDRLDIEYDITLS